MSITFDGANSKLEDTTAAGFNVATFTIVCWSYAAGQGENSFGKIFVADEAANGFVLQHQNSANTLGFVQFWTPTVGTWTFSATDAQWNTVAVAYDRSATGNNPTARVNFASATVTRTSTPAGTVVQPNTGYCIGNISAQTRTWDGRLAHLQFFSVILTADEMDAACRRPGSIRRGLVAWWPMLHATYINDYVGGSLPTATSLATGDGPPTIGIF